MKVTFLGQGFEPVSANATGKHLENYLKDTSFHVFTGISAFASEAGVYGLSDYIKRASHLKALIIVGIDQGGTSKEALEEISGLNIEGYLYYQRERPIFHPKIYLFEGTKNIKLILGSSNLTGMGLFTNVESSLLIEFDVSDQEGQVLLADIKKYYNTLFDLSDPNLFKINRTTIADFVAQGLVPDEATRRSHYHKNTTTAVSVLNTTTKIPSRTIAKVPSSFPRKNRRVTTSDTTATTTVTVQGVASHIIFPTENLVWESGPLTERDLNIPRNANTNRTGSMGFKKGLTEGIDQKHYFRDEVFSSLIWRQNTRRRFEHLEKATAMIRLIVNGIDHGVFPLTVTHNPRTDTLTYNQNNYPTSLSWGATAKRLIANRDLIGTSASLYRDRTTNDAFILVIE